MKILYLFSLFLPYLVSNYFYEESSCEHICGFVHSFLLSTYLKVRFLCDGIALSITFNQKEQNFFPQILLTILYSHKQCVGVYLPHFFFKFGVAIRFLNQVFVIHIVRGVCNFLGSVFSQRFEATDRPLLQPQDGPGLELSDGPVLQLRVTAQFYLESKGKYILFFLNFILFLNFT